MRGTSVGGPGADRGRIGPVLFCTGTDHHRFDRLVDLADEWAASETARSLGVDRVVVQHGASRAPSVAEGHAHLAHSELTLLLDRACAVVCHGGPGLISDARSAGHVPVCVPRDPRRGEHVDDHQQRFAAAADLAGMVRLATDRRSLTDHLVRTVEGDEGVDAPGRARPADSVARLATVLDEIAGTRPRRRASMLSWARGGSR